MREAHAFMGEQSFFHGKLDNVNMFNRELHAKELGKLSDKDYNSNLLLTNKTMLDLRFDVGDNSTSAYDSSYLLNQLDKLCFSGSPLIYLTSFITFVLTVLMCMSVLSVVL